MKKRMAVIISVICLFITTAIPAAAWHDETHLAVAKAAGYKKWYNATGPDMAKIKAHNTEWLNHYFNNSKQLPVSLEMVWAQVERYNAVNGGEGHLYGAIIAAVRAYRDALRAGKYADYHLAYCLHYIADLSQPLHNIPYDDYNKSFHSPTDGVVEKEALDNPGKIHQHMYPVVLRQDHFEEDLAKEIVRIAELSRQLGLKLKAEKRNLTAEEAYVQLGHSASLIKAVLQYLATAK